MCEVLRTSGEEYDAYYAGWTKSVIS